LDERITHYTLNQHQLHYFTHGPLGVSAFRGLNANKGALKPFLTLINEKQVPAGSVLLIEDFDRLSRQEPLDAQDIIRSILKEKVTIVTLNNGMEYSWDRVNQEPHLLYIMTGAIILAHDESKKKQQRVQAAWAAKRDKAVNSKQILTRMCPRWLKVNQSKTEFIKIPENVQLVKKVFALAAKGHGQYYISKMLNNDNILSFTGKQWGSSSIRQLLGNRAVLGELQPHIRQGRQKRIKHGDPILDYYPRIISDELFNKAEQQRESRQNKKGRPSENYTNLFRGFLRCAHCSGTLTVDTNASRKLPGRKFNTYLFCHNHAVGRSCVSKRMRYDLFEEAFLHHITDFDITEVFATDKKQDLLALESELYQLNKRLKQAEKSIDNCTALMDSEDLNPDALKILASKLNKHSTEKTTVQSEISNLGFKLQTLQSASKNSTKIQKSIKQTTDKMKQLQGIELAATRERLASIINKVVSKIYLNLEPGTPTDQPTDQPQDSKGVKDSFGVLNSCKTAYSFAVIYTNGGDKLVEFDKNDPSKSWFAEEYTRDELSEIHDYTTD